MVWVVLIAALVLVIAIVALLFAAAVRLLVERRFAAALLLALATGGSAGALGADPTAYAVAGGAVSLALSAVLRARRPALGSGSRPAVSIKQSVAERVEPYERDSAASTRAGTKHPAAITAECVRGERVEAGPEPAQVPPRTTQSLVDIAWEEAAELAPGDLRVAEARARCEDLLRRIAAEPGDASADDWVDFVKQRLPELVDAAVAAASDGNELERRAVGSELAGALRIIGEEAAELLEGRQRAARDRFTTLRNYIASRTAPDSGWSEKDPRQA